MIAEYSGATYENGFTKDDPTIKWLWEIIHEYSLEQKKKLLFFTTGSDRAPIGGLGKMEFIIMKHGDDGDRYSRFVVKTCQLILWNSTIAFREIFFFYD